MISFRSRRGEEGEGRKKEKEREKREEKRGKDRGTHAHTSLERTGGRNTVRGYHGEREREKERKRERAGGHAVYRGRGEEGGTRESREIRETGKREDARVATA